jgi:hypothetical protein
MPGTPTKNRRSEQKSLFKILFEVLTAISEGLCRIGKEERLPGFSIFRIFIVLSATGCSPMT